ncbi:MAG: lipopolysaccharide assembly protein LapB [Gammaproteobacteria bacterium]
MAPEHASALLWLLLPVAAASGWYLARYSAHSRSPRRPLAPEYQAGLDHLLNEQPDQAIEIFLKLLEAQGDAGEIQLALGQLFRRRGEVDRAIQLHQGLIDRPTLSPAQRWRAMLELGVDYRHAGLFDRAEGLFQELIAQNQHPHKALRELLDIYVQEQDWERALGCAGELQSRGEALGAVAAQLYCERAEQCRQLGDLAAASPWVRRALEVDRTCVRASLIEGRLAQAAGQYEQAVSAYQRVETQDPALMAEALPPLIDCYLRLGRGADLEAYLQGLTGRRDDAALVLARADRIAAAQGPADAMRYLSQALQRKPAVGTIDALLDYAQRAGTALGRSEIAVLKRFTGCLVQGRAQYRCRHCGFSAKTLHWQCIGCHHWASVRPIPEGDCG